jgi:hypothetical protein
MDADFSCMRIYQNKNIYSISNQNNSFNDDSDGHCDDDHEVRYEMYHMPREMIEK